MHVKGLPCPTLVGLGRQRSASYPHYCSDPKGFDLEVLLHGKIPAGQYFLGIMCPTSCKLDLRDACGVCPSAKMKLGDNSTCADCKGIPNGHNTNDFCGLCGGDGLSCAISRHDLLEFGKNHSAGTFCTLRFPCACNCVGARRHACFFHRLPLTDALFCPDLACQPEQGHSCTN